MYISMTMNQPQRYIIFCMEMNLKLVCWTSFREFTTSRSNKKKVILDKQTLYIYIYIYQGFLKSGNLGTGFPATWPKWLRETTKVAARIIEWLRKSWSGCENYKLAARSGVHPSKVVSAVRASVKVAVGSQPLFDF